MPKCPRQPAFVPAHRTSIWVRPDGCAIDAGDDHGRWAASFLRADNAWAAMQELLRQGWLRFHIDDGQLNVALRALPTPAQLRTLDYYVRYPGVTVGMVDVVYGTPGQEQTRYLQGDAGTSTGKIAAFARKYLGGATLAGHIDEQPVGPDSFLHVWVRPDGEDLFCQLLHEGCAAKELKKLRVAPGADTILTLEALGWVRLSMYKGALSVEVATPPTAAQVSTLQKYFTTPGVVFRAANVNVVREGYLVARHNLYADVFQKMTAGRLAAWVEQQFQPQAAALAGFIDEENPSDRVWHHIWLSPEGKDISVEDHEEYATGYESGGLRAFERTGWIRVSLVAGALGVEMETVPTAAQLVTLAKYFDHPGIELKAASFGQNYIRGDGFTRWTAGRLAAWVASCTR